MVYVLELSSVHFSSDNRLSFFVTQHQSGTSAMDNTASIQLSVDATSKSVTNPTVSRPRPVSVPVHTAPADPAFRKLVSSSVFYACATESLLCRRSVFFSFVRVLLGRPWKQRLIWQSTASTEASFHSGPMCNPVCAKCLYVWVVLGYCHSDSVCVYLWELCAVYL